MHEREPRPTSRRRASVSGLLAITALVAAIVVAAVSLQHPGLGDTAPKRAQTPAVTSMAFLAGCGSIAVVAPLIVPIWCSSSDQELEDLTWSRWGTGTSEATGDFLDRPCACEGGAFDRYPVRVVLSAPARVAGTWRYSHLTLHFPASRPEWAFRAAFGFVWTEDGFVSEQDNV